MSEKILAASLPIFLAAGGTGGHMFPAEALAGELLARGYRPILVTDRRGGALSGALAQIETLSISAAGVAGRSLKNRLKALASLGIGFVQARSLLRRYKPVAVVGFGGYASFPTVLAASRAGIPTVIHEQNAVLGRANRLLAPRVSAIATSFDKVEGIPSGSEWAACSGNPVRAAVTAVRDAAYPQLDYDGALNVLVLGGSQGARIFSEILPGALNLLPEHLRSRLRLSQQCRPEDIDGVRATYKAMGVRVDLATFFADVPERLAGAHMAICRAGASTVAELMVAGRPAILVPYPHAIDDHQFANARAMDEAGGAWLMPQSAFTPESLAARLESLLNLPQTLIRSAACAHAVGRPDAAARLADMVSALLPAETLAPTERASAPAAPKPAKAAPQPAPPSPPEAQQGSVASLPRKPRQIRRIVKESAA